jgi:methylthioribose-1-phosphate isomerase
MRELSSTGLKIEKGHLLILDQQKLPREEVWLDIESTGQMIKAIQALKVRGAPLIGVAAACSLALWAEKNYQKEEFLGVAKSLREARPTAVNLMIAIDRVIKAHSLKPSRETITQTALDIFDEDVKLADAMAKNGAHLISDGDHILTHCNTGGLATVGLGTALGVILKAHFDKKRIHVFVDETRPLLQGARLNAWELKKHGVPHTIICDNMAATLMASARVNKVFVGSDRIATNGDFANKIGTYSLAVISKFHGVPFYPVAPHTTIDFDCASGTDIPIEERAHSEVFGVTLGDSRIEWTPSNSKAFNPSFDVTPVDLVTGLVTDYKYFSQSELKNACLLQMPQFKSRGLN